MSNHDIDPGTVEPPFDDEQFEDVPGEPEGEPEGTIEGYEVYISKTFDGIVPEWVLVVEYPESNDVHMRKWLFAGKNSIMVFRAYQRHRYGPGDEPPQVDSQVKPCCFRIEPEHGLRAEHCPDEVRDLVARITDAPVASMNERDHEDTAEE